jgi:hypothetical protein
MNDISEAARKAGEVSHEEWHAYKKEKTMISYAKAREHAVVLENLQAKLLASYDDECANNQGVIKISHNRLIHSAVCNQLLRQMDAISASLEYLNWRMNNE